MCADERCGGHVDFAVDHNFEEYFEWSEEEEEWLLEQ
jgi:hypothetical protein